MLMTQAFDANCDRRIAIGNADARLRRARTPALGLAATLAALSIWSSASALLSQHLDRMPHGDGELRRHLRNTSAKTMPPPVPTMHLLEIPADRARRLNAAVAFSTRPNPAALPFRFAGDEQSRLRAVDCLASAVYYEAGGDIDGQRAVAQVVLNRVRHPAFPHTVCGVVYQGTERSTGCQFTFTCDGALRRSPLPALWNKAQGIAREAIGGRVYTPVGLATHYHTDWVMPVWSGRLEKITNVHTHLFFRWPGEWGRPSAFRQRKSAGAEPFEAKLIAISEVHRPPQAGAASTAFGKDAEGMAPAGEPDAIQSAGNTYALNSIDMRGSKLRLVHPDGDAFGFLLPRSMPGSFGLLALDVCRGRRFCKVMGWTDPAAVPSGFPVPYDAQRKMAFLYVHDGDRHGEIVAWDCAVFPRRDPAQCLDAATTRWDAVRQLAHAP